MTHLRLLAFNTLTGFSDYNRREALLGFIKQVNPDIAFFSDAFAADAPQSDIMFMHDALAQLGYTSLVSQEERNDRTDWTRTMGMYRRDIDANHAYIGEKADTYVVTINGRKIVGKYFDDRNEANRLAALGDITGADVIMGDFNAMHGQVLVAKLLRLLIPLGNSFKEIDTDFRITKNPVLRFISLFQRFARMGQGELLQRIEELGLIDTNVYNTPTIHGVAQIDHIMVKKSTAYSGFTVHKAITLSDHKPLSVEIEF